MRSDERGFLLQFFAEGDPAGAPAQAPAPEPNNTLMGGTPPPPPQEPAPDPAGTPPPAEPAKPQAPERYQPFAVPAGMEIPEADHAEFSGLAREMNLTQEQAQKLVDYHAKHWAGAVAEFEQRAIREMEEWETQTKNHPEFGGAKFGENLGLAHKFVERFGGEELRKALNATRVGSHPAFFAAFAKAGRLLVEDRFTPGGGVGVEEDSPEATARRIYKDIKM